MKPPEECPALAHLDDPAAQVGHHLARLGKLFTHLRHQMPHLRPGVDTTAFPILFALAHGPRRVSAVADAIFSDISTVSRQVATLEKHGLVARSADPEDRRASLLALSDDGTQFITALVERRAAWFRAIVADWPEADVAALATLLERFLDATVTHADDLFTANPLEGPPQ